MIAALASVVPAHAQPPNTVQVSNTLATNITPYFKCPVSYGCPDGKWLNFGQIAAYAQFAWDFTGGNGTWHFTYTAVGAPPPDNNTKEVAVFTINGGKPVFIILGAGSPLFVLP